jgi:hypothetical protein
MCPACGQNAPLVYRGVAAYCAACGAPRAPLTGKSLQLAGQPSRVGGVLARVLGWLVLVFGILVATGLGLTAQALFPNGIAGAVVGLPIGIASVLLGVVLLRGGAKLDRSGASAELQARSEAVRALAAHKNGTLTAADVAASLDMPRGEAEALLDELARTDIENVAVDIDPNGALVYRFQGRSRVRVDPEIAASPNRDEWERLEAQEAASARKDATSRTRPQR